MATTREVKKVLDRCLLLLTLKDEVDFKKKHPTSERQHWMRIQGEEKKNLMASHINILYTVKDRLAKTIDEVTKLKGYITRMHEELEGASKNTYRYVRWAEDHNVILALNDLVGYPKTPVQQVEKGTQTVLTLTPQNPKPRKRNRSRNPNFDRVPSEFKKPNAGTGHRYNTRSKSGQVPQSRLRQVTEAEPESNTKVSNKKANTGTSNTKPNKENSDNEREWVDDQAREQPTTKSNTDKEKSTQETVHEQPKEKPTTGTNPSQNSTSEPTVTGKENNAKKPNTETGKNVPEPNSTQSTEESFEEVRVKQEPGQATAAVPVKPGKVPDPSEWIYIDCDSE